MNPYAILEPVSVGGVTIRQAALHNEDDIRRKDIRIGEKVIIQRAGEVIPEVVGPVPSKRTGKEKEFSLMEKLPKNERGESVCPSCGKNSIVRPEGEVMYYCANAACPAQAQQRIGHFTSRGAMDIRGIGENLSALLFTQGLVNDIADLYSLKDKKNELVQLEKLGEKSADNILAAIEKSKKRPLGRIIFALGIRHVGSETAEILADAFRTIDALTRVTVEELEKIDTIGPKIAESIVAFFQQADNQDILLAAKSAAQYQKALLQDASFLTSDVLLRKITVEPAEFLRLNTGSLESGKDADMVLIDLNRPNLIPSRLDNVVENLIWASDGSEIKTVIANGEVLKLDYRFTLLDFETIVKEVQLLSEMLADYMITAKKIIGTGAHK